ncbi:RDD family protein [Ferdinandcohnia quinoae]|uniref:RDD family protein n=1 Tax=Fredinandcohnia quinoae TaxID=2918902 RepID=A0AAW5E8L8_9BACI|nr:RDD family protein [Fredinandcohnia sp. SECRCQ15]MCH1627590.1 RDD family protein [Fredinandcohnia sp. SECRCQ15]
MDLTREDLQGSGQLLDSEPHVHADIRYSGFWMRFWAYLLDLIVIGSINRILIYPIFRALDISLSEREIFSAASIATAVIFFLYFVLMTKFFNQTLGKMVFGIKVVSLGQQPLTWNTVIFREFLGRYIAKLFFIGYIVVAFTPKKQGVHDLFSDTTVIHTR